MCKITYFTMTSCVAAGTFCKVFLKKIAFTCYDVGIA